MMGIKDPIQDLDLEFRAILDSSYDGIYVANKHGYTIYVNRAYEKLTGGDVNSIIYKHIKEVADKGCFSNAVTEMVLEKKKTITDVIRCKNTQKQLIVTGSPVFDNHGNLKIIVLNLRDITELVALENQLSKTNVLSNKYYLELSRLRMKEGKIISNSLIMKKVIELALRVAQVDSSVLIQGESGVGKEVISELIHGNSSRNNKPFIRINCGAIPENLLESELFGYESGAFSGANKQGKVGLFEVAEGGTLLLDEISEMSLFLQVKLLRAIQDGEIRKIGGTDTINLNVRIIAITNRDLSLLVKEDLFRKDLFYRLNVVPIYIPPLRERQEDIPLFIFFFLKHFNEKYKMDKKISPNAIDLLTAFNWPGNVRELENVIERIVVTTPHEIIDHKDLPEYINLHNELECEISVNKIMPLKKATQMLEKELISRALDLYKCNKKAALVLGVDRTTVLRKAIKYKLHE